MSRLLRVTRMSAREIEVRRVSRFSASIALITSSSMLDDRCSTKATRVTATAHAASI